MRRVLFARAAKLTADPVRGLFLSCSGLPGDPLQPVFLFFFGGRPFAEASPLAEFRFILVETSVGSLQGFLSNFYITVFFRYATNLACSDPSFPLPYLPPLIQY